ncbi:MAG: alginate O-acetyltransferase [Limisphaerales bacterium]
MNTTSTLSTLTRWTDTILIALFMTLLWLPTLDSVFHFDRTPARNENRATTIFPKLQLGKDGVQTYVAWLEAYFNDHFGCRKCLVQWHNGLRWSLFKENNKNNSGKVLVGKQGWLFYTEEQMIDHYSGLLQFTPEELHGWQVLLEKRRDWLAQRGIAYLFVVTPDKHTIYPEELPRWVTKIHPQTKLDQFFAYMREHSTVPVLDLRPAVRDAKSVHPPYKKTDTHWNSFGGFIAYQKLVPALAHILPELKLEPMLLSSFVLTNRSEAGGDLAGFLGSSMVESNFYSFIPKPGLREFPIKADHPLDPHITTTTNAYANGSLIMFQDSFALAWFQFLGYHFNQVTYLKRYDLDPARIEREKPNIVVSEMVERNFNIEDPSKLLAKEALN